MRGLVSYVVRGRRQAITAATLTALLSTVFGSALVVFAPLMLVAVALYFTSAAVVALVTLRYGIYEGALVMLGPAVYWSLPMLFAGGSDIPSTVLAVPLVSTLATTLVPVVLMAGVLRATGSQGLMLLVAAVLIGVGAVAMHAADVQPSRWLLEQLRPAFERAFPDADWSAADAPAAAGAALSHQLGAGLQAANLLVVLSVTVMLARWWHAGLDNPGGFGREFRQLRHDRRVAVVVLAVVALAAVSGSGAGMVLLPLLLALFMFQGLAVAHAAAARAQGGRSWLIALYVLLVLPYVNGLGVVAVAAAGVLDTWLDFRRRFGAGAGA